MELQQDFLQRAAVGVGRCFEVLALGFGRNVVRNFFRFADQEPYMRGSAVLTPKAMAEVCKSSSMK